MKTIRAVVLALPDNSCCFEASILEAEQVVVVIILMSLVMNSHLQRATSVAVTKQAN